MCSYSRRLFKEWTMHGKIVLAVDFDDTLYPWGLLRNDKDRAKTIKLVKKAVQLGAYVVIFTASKKERHHEMVKYCAAIGINVDSINENPIELPYGNDGSKIFYNHNLCDRSGLKGSLKILKRAINKYKKYKQRLIFNKQV